jgi:hypothetical protein
VEGVGCRRFGDQAFGNMPGQADVVEQVIVGTGQDRTQRLAHLPLRHDLAKQGRHEGQGGHGGLLLRLGQGGYVPDVDIRQTNMDDGCDLEN